MKLILQFLFAYTYFSWVHVSDVIEQSKKPRALVNKTTQIPDSPCFISSFPYTIREDETSFLVMIWAF